jgi:tRNA threonylcarbamoyl adenosine modification protein (Sua5/YciO/YrdC/YwlC family)
MTQRFVVHPTHPQSRLLRQAAQVLRDGGLVAMPTDACYVVACHLDDKAAVERLRALRGLDDKHLLTLICRDLSELGVYAQVDNWQYRFLRDWTPGPYTFVLPATREVPRRLWHPSRKTIGLRVPSSPVAAGLLEAHGAPLLGSSLILPGESDPLHDPDDIVERLARRIDAVVDAGGQGMQSTTVVDLTGDEPLVTRLGCGPVEGRIALGPDGT